MTTTEKFCLKWNDFQQNIISSYHTLRDNFDFSDVTLVCDEIEEIKAHRIILTASSPFFNTVLKRNNHSHPTIYMRGLKSKDLVAIVDFIYHGEAKIYQDDLDGFLALAKELQLKGLTGSQNDSKNNEENNVEIPNVKINQQIKQKKDGMIKKSTLKNMHFESEVNHENYDEQEKHILDTSMVPVKTDHDIETLNHQISTMTQKVDDKNYNWKCTVCGKLTANKQDIRRHVEVHIEGATHICNRCGKTSRSSSALRKHKSAKCLSQ